MTASSPLTVTDPDCVADPLTPGESAFGSLAFPWISQTTDGTLVMTYHDGRDGASGGNFTSRIKTSTDLGVTWTPGRVVWDDSLDTGAQITVLASGDWLMTSQGYVADVPAGVYTKRSTDGGATWGPTQFVTDTACSGGHTYTSSAPLQLVSGTLLWPVYGPDAGHTGDISKVLASSDGGATWSLLSTILALPGGVGAQEPVLQQMPDGTIIAMLRCTDHNARRTVSADGGATWTAPTIVMGGCDSRIDWIRLASGRCVASYRDAVTACAMVTWSSDAMVTVTAPAQYHGPDKRTSYSSLAEVQPGVVCCVVGEIDNTENNGRLVRRYLMEGYGQAPTGQGIYLDSRRLVAGEARTVATDAFRRPDNMQGLGSADSGQQWQDAGSNWQLVGGAAKVTSGTIRVVTVDGPTWGMVEADLMWSGSTSSPLGLAAKYNPATKKALVAKLDSSGHTLRISIYTAGVMTDLASASVSFLPGIWHHWRWVVKGDNATLFIEGDKVISWRLTASNHTDLDAGTRWGLLGGGSSGAVYQATNVRVST